MVFPPRRNLVKEISVFFQVTQELLSQIAEFLSCCRKSPISKGKSGRLKPGKLMNLIGRIRNKTRKFCYHCVDIQGAGFFSSRAFLLTHPVYESVF